MATATIEFLSITSQQAVEVVPDVLLRHRERDEAEQRAQLPLRHLHRLLHVLARGDARVVGGRHALQVEPALARLQHDLRGLRVDAQQAIVGQRAQQVLELSRR